ncbi:MAG: hypothetical protein Q9M26_00685 [Mariprofundales bacterium]|nr:hypothetical protein [Mariprofundales bacterium]
MLTRLTNPRRRSCAFTSNFAHQGAQGYIYPHGWIGIQSERERRNAAAMGGSVLCTNIARVIGDMVELWCHHIARQTAAKGNLAHQPY